jgi:hypothetical protein
LRLIVGMEFVRSVVLACLGLTACGASVPAGSPDGSADGSPAADVSPEDTGSGSDASPGVDGSQGGLDAGQGGPDADAAAPHHDGGKHDAGVDAAVDAAAVNGCLLGAAVGSGQTVGFDRACATFASAGGNQSIDCEEAAIAQQSGVAGFHFGARRVYDKWPADPPTDQFDDDLKNDRLTIWDFHIECNTLGITWQDVAGAQSGSPIYTTLQSMGSKVAQWQATAAATNSKWKGEQYFTFEHEADWGQSNYGCGAPADWEAAYKNVVTIWKAAGVTSQLHYGMILIGGKLTDWTSFWPANDTWLASTLTWAGADPYNWYSPTCNPNQSWSSFAEVSSAFYEWVEHPAKYGHPTLQPLITETGTREGPAGSTTQTKALWFSDMATYIQTSWPDLFALTYFDEGLGQCPNYVDTSAASWTAWKTVATTPYFLP